MGVLGTKVFLRAPFLFFFKKNLAVLVLVAVCRVFSCSIRAVSCSLWNLVA